MEEEKDTYATTWEYGVVQDGHKECDHCNGYGSSLKDAWDVNVCTVCGGSGLVRLPMTPERLARVQEQSRAMAQAVGPTLDEITRRDDG